MWGEGEGEEKVKTNVTPNFRIYFHRSRGDYIFLALSLGELRHAG